MPVLRGATVPVHARHDQAVEIHWRLADGKTFTERRTLPPKATAGDLYLAAVENYMAHMDDCDGCALEEICDVSDALTNQIRLARKIWQNSAHRSPMKGSADA